MRSFIHHRAGVLGVVLVVVAAATLVAYARAGGAPAASQQSAPVWLDTASPALTGHDVAVSGGIDAQADLSGAAVKIYKREVGESVDTLVGDAPVTFNVMSGNVFDAVIPAVARSCIVTVAWEGNADYLASTTWMFAGVRPKLAIRAPVATRTETRVRVTIAPEQPLHHQGMTRPPFLADVQCRRHGVWTRFPAELGSMGTDGESWCVYTFYDVKPGTYVIRARFAGTNYNVASVSSITRITVP
jgi:hypothetical protein